MSHKTNSIALRLNYSVGWKWSNFPQKKIYTRDVTLLLRIYLLLKGYLALYNYKLLFYEWKTTYLTKIIYLTIIKQRKIKRKKAFWRPRNILNKKKYENIKYILYTKTFLNKINLSTNLKKFDLKYFKSLKSIFFSVLTKKRLTLKPYAKNLRPLYYSVHPLLKQFTNINKTLVTFRKMRLIINSIESLLSIYAWQSNYYKKNKQVIFTINFLKYFTLLLRLLLQLKKGIISLMLKNTFYAKGIKYKIKNNLLHNKVKKHQIFCNKERLKYISKNNKRLLLFKKSNKFYFIQTPWTLGLKKKKKINKLQRNLLQGKLWLITQFFYKSKQSHYSNITNAKKKIKIFKNKKIAKIFKLYRRPICKNTLFYKSLTNNKKLIILKPKYRKSYKLKAKSKLKKEKIKIKIYKHLNLQSRFQLQYTLANWVKYFFKVNVHIKIYNPLLSRTMKIELKKDKPYKKPIYHKYYYLTKKRKKYYLRDRVFINTAKIIKKYTLKTKYKRWKSALHYRFLPILNIATIYMEPQLLADQIAKELQRTKSHQSVFDNIRRELQEHSLGKTLGLQIAIKGRFNSSNRTRLEYILLGHVPRNSYKTRVAYALGHSHARIGAFGVKIWMFY